MIVRGSIYVVTTPLSPDLCLIGFSAKTLELRIKEMMKKKPGQRFIIEYAVVVDNPHRHCHIAREKLMEQGKHEWKEWFRCAPDEAAMVIRDAIGRARIYSEEVRGEERLQKDIETEKKGASVSGAGRGSDQKQATSMVVQPLQDSGALRRKGEEDVRREALGAAAEKKADSEPLPAETATPVGDSPVGAGGEGQPMIPETAKPAEISAAMKNPEVQRYLLKDQEAALEKEKEEVRTVLAERHKDVRRQKEEKKRSVRWIPGRATEEQGSLFWEITITLLADVACFYLVFAAKGVFISAVGVVLVAFFTLLLIDSFRTLRDRKRHSAQKRD